MSEDDEEYEALAEEILDESEEQGVSEESNIEETNVEESNSKESEAEQLTESD